MHWPLNVLALKTLEKTRETIICQWKPMLNNHIPAFEGNEIGLKCSNSNKNSTQTFSNRVSVFSSARENFSRAATASGQPLHCLTGPSCLPAQLKGTLFSAQLRQPAMHCPTSQRGRQPKVATWRGNQWVVSVFLSTRIRLIWLVPTWDFRPKIGSNETVRPQEHFEVSKSSFGEQFQCKFAL